MLFFIDNFKVVFVIIGIVIGFLLIIVVVGSIVFFINYCKFLFLYKELVVVGFENVVYFKDEENVFIFEL